MIELMLVNSKASVKIPDSGAGPDTIVAGDETYGYFGSLPNQNFFTPQQIENAGVTPLTAGTATDRTITNIWQKYIYNGKILFIPKRALRTGVTWDQLYNCGLVYGEDGNGKYPSSTPTSQKTLLSLKDEKGRTRWYMVRLVKGSTVDPTSTAVASTAVINSEYTMTVERTYPTSGNPVKWGKLGSPGNAILAMETWDSTTSYTITVNGNSSYGQRNRTLKTAASSDWLPCLELMPLGYSPYPTVPDNGPGSAEMKAYAPGTNSGYFGEVSAGEMPTLAQIDAAGVIPVAGTNNPAAATISWSKLYYKGKVFYYPNAALRTNTDWNSIYASGFVYGVDGNGKYPVDGAPVNQLRTFIFTDINGQAWEFLVRLPKMSSVDPYSHTSSGAQYAASEYGQCIQNVYRTSSLAWGSLTWVESLGQETNGTYNTSNAMSASTFDRISNWPKNGSSGKKTWLPVLELVGKVS